MNEQGLPMIIALCGAIAVLLVILGLPALRGDALFALLRRPERIGAEALRDMFVTNVTPRDLAVYGLLSAMLLALLVYGLVGQWLITALAAGLGASAPLFYVLHQRQQRMVRFEERLPLAIDQMVGATRAGFNLARAIEDTAKTAPEPVAQEFSMMVQDYHLASDIAGAIENTRRRLRSRSFDLMATALKINREKGGNLPAALDTMSVALKEIWRLEQRIITASAEGRKAVKWISAMPVLIFLIVSLMQPSIIDTLTGTFLGGLLLFLAAALYAVALYWLRQVLRVDI